MVEPTVIRDENSISRLWIHEISRVFHDRLNNNEDKDWFYELIIEVLGRYFKGNKTKKEDVFA